jgi:glucokinase
VPLKKEIEAAVGLPAVVANDVRCFTLAEFRFGAAQGSRTVVGMAIGTGIGGGLVVDGKLHTGLDGVAGEIGHIIIDVNGPKCGCGSYGCMEALAAAPAITAMAVKAIRQSAGATKIFELAGGDLNRVSPKIVAQAASEGDPHAMEIMNRAGFYIGVGIANLLAVLCPDCVVIGGGIAKAGEVLFAPIRKTLKATVHTAPLRKTKIVPAKLGTDAGVIGAAAWAMQVE